jgi:hypothetical protein
MHLKHRVYFLLAAGALAAAARLGAVTTDTAEQVTYDHFEDGQFTNIALPSSGGLRLAPNLTLLAWPTRMATSTWARATAAKFSR